MPVSEVPPLQEVPRAVPRAAGTVSEDVLRGGSQPLLEEMHRIQPGMLVYGSLTMQQEILDMDDGPGWDDAMSVLQGELLTVLAESGSEWAGVCLDGSGWSVPYSSIFPVKGLRGPLRARTDAQIGRSRPTHILNEPRPLKAFKTVCIKIVRGTGEVYPIFEGVDVIGRMESILEGLTPETPEDLAKLYGMDPRKVIRVALRDLDRPYLGISGTSRVKVYCDDKYIIACIHSPEESEDQVIPVGIDVLAERLEDMVGYPNPSEVPFQVEDVGAIDIPNEVAAPIEGGTDADAAF
jgi:hypothetical protein